MNSPIFTLFMVVTIFGYWAAAEHGSSSAKTVCKVLCTVECEADCVSGSYNCEVDQCEPTGTYVAGQSSYYLIDDKDPGVSCFCNYGLGPPSGLSRTCSDAAKLKNSGVQTDVPFDTAIADCILAGEEQLGTASPETSPPPAPLIPQEKPKEEVKVPDTPKTEEETKKPKEEEEKNDKPASPNKPGSTQTQPAPKKTVPITLPANVNVPKDVTDALNKLTSAAADQKMIFEKFAAGAVLAVVFVF